MQLNIKAIIVGFVIAGATSLVLGYFGYILGGLVAGYLIAGDYIDGGINGAISSGIAGLLLGLFYLILFGSIFSAYYGYGNTQGLVFASIIVVVIQAVVAGLVLGGIGGFGGIFVREQMELRNMQTPGNRFREGNNGYLVCDKCSEYYKLQHGEKADDFSSECECGGKLKYNESTD